MDGKTYIESLVAKGRVAVEEISGYSQEQIDKMVQAIAQASMRPRAHPRGISSPFPMHSRASRDASGRTSSESV